MEKAREDYILIFRVSHPSTEWIENIIFLVTFTVILCIVFFGTCCVVRHSVSYQQLYLEYMPMKAKRPHNHEDV